MIHGLELQIQAQDLIKAYQTSTCFQDIYHYMSCISKTACFLVNYTPLSLQFGWNEELKGSNGSHHWSAIIELHPQNRTRPHFWRVKPQPIRGFPAIEPVTFQHKQ